MTYTETDMMAAWIAGYKNAEYRFRCLPNLTAYKTAEGNERVRVSMRTDSAEDDVRQAIMRGDHRTFSVWISEYLDDKERRAKNGFSIEPDSLRIRKATDGQDSGESAS
jgi:hypothetical protein